MGQDKGRFDPLFCPKNLQENGPLLNPGLRKIHEDITRLIDFGYEVGKNQRPGLGNFSKTPAAGNDGYVIQDWTVLDTISGCRGGVYGNQFKDPNAVILVYSKQENTLLVISHGSQNAADWGTNYDSLPRSLQEFGFQSSGKVHEGFAKKFSSYQSDLVQKINNFVLTLENQAACKILFTGHSQGAALAQLGALKVAEFFQSNGFPGEKNFENTLANRIGCYTFSAPVLLDLQGVQSFHQIIGCNNIIRQNVEADPVPNLGLGLYQAAGQLALDSNKAIVQESYRRTAETYQLNVENGNVSLLSYIPKILGVVINPVGSIQEASKTLFGLTMGACHYVSKQGRNGDNNFDPALASFSDPENLLREGLKKHHPFLYQYDLNTGKERIFQEYNPNTNSYQNYYDDFEIVVFEDVIQKLSQSKEVDNLLSNSYQNYEDFEIIDGPVQQLSDKSKKDDDFEIVVCEDVIQKLSQSEEVQNLLASQAVLNEKQPIVPETKPLGDKNKSSWFNPFSWGRTAVKMH